MQSAVEIREVIQLCKKTILFISGFKWLISSLLQGGGGAGIDNAHITLTNIHFIYCGN